MTESAGTGNKRKRRAILLALLIVVNILCAIFFVVDVIADFEDLRGPQRYPLLLEAVASAALVLCTSFLLVELRRVLQRNASMEIGLTAARGEMQTVIDRFFSEWRLSDAERDVALLLLKGLGNEAIASIRGTATGTVRAQCAGIYAKAGVDGRSQLMSIFMEELLSEPLPDLANGTQNRDPVSA